MLEKISPITDKIIESIKDANDWVKVNPAYVQNIMGDDFKSYYMLPISAILRDHPNLIFEISENSPGKHKPYQYKYVSETEKNNMVISIKQLRFLNSDTISFFKNKINEYGFYKNYKPLYVSDCLVHLNYNTTWKPLDMKVLTAKLAMSPDDIMTVIDVLLNKQILHKNKDFPNFYKIIMSEKDYEDILNEDESKILNDVAIAEARIEEIKRNKAAANRRYFEKRTGAKSSLTESNACSTIIINDAGSNDDNTSVNATRLTSDDLLDQIRELMLKAAQYDSISNELAQAKQEIEMIKADNQVSLMAFEKQNERFQEILEENEKHKNTIESLKEENKMLKGYGKKLKEEVEKSADISFNKVSIALDNYCALDKSMKDSQVEVGKLKRTVNTAVLDIITAIANTKYSRSDESNGKDIQR